MATFTIDLLSGQVYLFSGNFNGSGSTPTSGSTYPQVNTYSDLPPANTNAGKIYVVRTGSGTYVVGRKDSGLYYSNGSIWSHLGNTPAYFSSNNFQVYDNVDITKGIKFVTSGITSGVFRNIEFQNNDGIVALLSDLVGKVDYAVFTNYTGNTQTVLNQLQADIQYISGITTNIGKKIQLISTGSTDVNTVLPTKIVWNTANYYDVDIYNWSGGTAIWFISGGTYSVQYHITLLNDSANQTHSVGSFILKNSGENIDASYGSTTVVGPNAGGELSLPPFVITVSNGDKLELNAFRIGNSGIVNTVGNSVYLMINKLS